MNRVFIILAILLICFGGILFFATHKNALVQSNQIIVTEPIPSSGNNLQLRTFHVISLTPSPAPTFSNSSPFMPNSPATTIPITTPKIGGPTAGYYCIDDVDPDMCDDTSSYLVAKATSGVAGTCGTIISWTHKLVDSLPQVMKGTRNSLSPAVSSPACGYTAGPHTSPNYISTYFVIDAYNLAGFHELSKTNAKHVSPSELYNWWIAAPAGYIFIPYSSTVVQQFASGQRDLSGCVMFLHLGASYHIGIVNALELFNSHGDGVISILQSGTRMYIDRFPVVGWGIQNASTNQTNTNGVAGFGCHT